MEKLSPNRAQLFLSNKYTVFTMGGTVALRSVKKKFQESYSSAANGVLAISQKYQNFKNLEKATLLQLVHVVIPTVQ